MTMLTIKDIELMNKNNKLDPNLKYKLKRLSDGFGVISTPPTGLLDKDAIICCKPIDKCLELLNGLDYEEI